MLKIKAIIIADIIAYYCKMSMMEVFLSNGIVLQPVTLLRNETCYAYHPENCTKFFVMAMCERLLLKESYNLPSTEYWETS